MAEHRPILKNNQNTCHPRSGFTPKTCIPFPKTGFFLCQFVSLLNSVVEKFVTDYRNADCTDARSIEILPRAQTPVFVSISFFCIEIDFFYVTTEIESGLLNGSLNFA